MNLLILSAGTRNKIVQYFKKEIGGKGTVIATDCSKLAPAIYEADKYYITPRIDENGYLEKILEICKDEKVNALFTLIDPEISLLAKNVEKFRKIGVMPIISSYEQVEMCFDKYAMYQYLTNNGFKTAKSYIDKECFFRDLQEETIQFPVFVKPVKGSASININKVTKKEEINLLFQQHNNLMIQEFMNGQEYGSDIYVDMISKEVISVFIKKKIKMRAGETDKSISVKNEKLEKILIEFVKKAGFVGIIDVDIFEINGEFYISEVNPRFGGGYPHAYACGVNVPQYIINNIKGISNTPEIGQYQENVYMMKYNEIKILKEEQNEY